MRHVAVMALTGAIGLVAIFAVDLLNFFYISRLGEKPIAAAVGFAGAVSFFQISIAIGLTIGVGATVSAAIGSQKPGEAQRHRHDQPHRDDGADARHRDRHGRRAGAAARPPAGGVARRGRWRRCICSSPRHRVPLMSLGMCCAALLRSAGAARRAMNVTLFAAVAVAVMDPIFIFALHLRLEGAAISTVLSRILLAGRPVCASSGGRGCSAGPNCAGRWPISARSAMSRCPRS